MENSVSSVIIEVKRNDARLVLQVEACLKTEWEYNFWWSHDLKIQPREGIMKAREGAYTDLRSWEQG